MRGKARAHSHNAAPAAVAALFTPPLVGARSCARRYPPPCTHRAAVKSLAELLQECCSFVEVVHALRCERGGNGVACKRGGGLNAQVLRFCLRMQALHTQVLHHCTRTPQQHARTCANIDAAACSMRKLSLRSAHHAAITQAKDDIAYGVAAAAASLLSACSAATASVKLRVHAAPSPATK